MFMYSKGQPLDTIFICDIARNQTNPGIYVTLENVKNGNIKISKYNGKDKKRTENCHIIVLANIYPDYTAWSIDRY